ncbi:hypothetical protein ACFQ9X_07075 [Catenulispora yoronensis]
MVLAGMMVLVLGSTVAYAGYWYYRINHNIKGAPLHGAVVPPSSWPPAGSSSRPRTPTATCRSTSC